MAKETQKEKIARLEEELKEWKELAKKLNNEITEMTEKMDRGFEASGAYKQMKDKIFRLEHKNKQFEKEHHNDRGAGRKAKFTDREKETIRMYRIQGKTINELAKMYKCSTGLIHKIIN
ncbi:Hin recombinase [Marinisporobacter balticus]|uniref:Helix-turn-helix resolvase-like protein n=1 Tax=Marinisporobacter balticus TaxID=2018667 RepID=A0A4R2KB90_9FIRM|nr:Hin recombinase [Marinisporobacter balticus]TCO69482.1 hypothetical protein EV214_1316 [Marinisporobacter balticus]